MSLFKKFGQEKPIVPDADLEAFALHVKQLTQQRAQQSMAAQSIDPWGGLNTHSRVKQLDMYERTQLALQQLQILFSAGELEKHELLNATRMTLSLDRENLTVVEEIIKAKLG